MFLMYHGIMIIGRGDIKYGLYRTQYNLWFLKPFMVYIGLYYL